MFKIKNVKDLNKDEIIEFRKFIVKDKNKGIKEIPIMLHILNIADSKYIDEDVLNNMFNTYILNVKINYDFYICYNSDKVIGFIFSGKNKMGSEISFYLTKDYRYSNTQKDISDQIIKLLPNYNNCLIALTDKNNTNSQKLVLRLGFNLLNTIDDEAIIFNKMFSLLEEKYIKVYNGDIKFDEFVNGTKDIEELKEKYKILLDKEMDKFTNKGDIKYIKYSN